MGYLCIQNVATFITLALIYNRLQIIVTQNRNTIKFYSLKKYKIFLNFHFFRL